MKIVIASDSFKGSLSSNEVAETLSSTIRKYSQDIVVETFAMADGGEGTASILAEHLNAQKRSVAVRNPRGRFIDAEYYTFIDFDGTPTTILDMASASGLTLLSKEERSAMHTSSIGTADIIVDAFERGCRRFLMGIGGSATCDCGMGMLEGLGVEFYDEHEERLNGCGASLSRVARIDLSKGRKDIFEAEFHVICDVDNPLYGPQGAAFVYAPQKGASAADVNELDKGLRHFATKITECRGVDVSKMPGAGAAGGIGGALMAFFNAKLEPGIDVMLDYCRFEEAISDASLIITGEGRMDRQTLCGKLPMGVLRRAQRVRVPVIAVCGIAQERDLLRKAGFAAILSTKPDNQSITEAMTAEYAKSNLRATIMNHLPTLIKLYD